MSDEHVKEFESSSEMTKMKTTAMPNMVSILWRVLHDCTVLDSLCVHVSMSFVCSSCPSLRSNFQDVCSSIAMRVRAHVYLLSGIDVIFNSYYYYWINLGELSVYRQFEIAKRWGEIGPVPLIESSRRKRAPGRSSLCIKRGKRMMRSSSSSSSSVCRLAFSSQREMFVHLRVLSCKSLSAGAVCLLIGNKARIDRKIKAGEERERKREKGGKRKKTLSS